MKLIRVERADLSAIDEAEILRSYQQEMAKYREELGEEREAHEEALKHWKKAPLKERARRQLLKLQPPRYSPGKKMKEWEAKFEEWQRRVHGPERSWKAKEPKHKRIVLLSVEGKIPVENYDPLGALTGLRRSKEVSEFLNSLIEKFGIDPLSAEGAKKQEWGDSDRGPIRIQLSREMPKGLWIHTKLEWEAYQDCVTRVQVELTTEGPVPGSILIY